MANQLTRSAGEQTSVAECMVLFHTPTGMWCDLSFSWYARVHTASPSGTDTVKTTVYAHSFEQTFRVFLQQSLALLVSPGSRTHSNLAAFHI